MPFANFSLCSSELFYFKHAALFSFKISSRNPLNLVIYSSLCRHNFLYSPETLPSTVQLLRRSGFIIMNVYIPSLLLLVISYLTLYFTPTNFQVRVLASLTSLLVMATLFTQVRKIMQQHLTPLWWSFTQGQPMLTRLPPVSGLQYIKSQVFLKSLYCVTIEKKKKRITNVCLAENSNINIIALSVKMLILQETTPQLPRKMWLWGSQTCLQIHAFYEAPKPNFRLSLCIGRLVCLSYCFLLNIKT